MTDALPVDLAYGHTGEATYNEQRQEWTFNRVPGTYRLLKVVAEPFQVSKGRATWTVPSSGHTAYSRTQNLRKIATTHPELTPAVRFSSSLAQQSETYEELASIHDPLRSELLAFGDVPLVDQDISGLKIIPVAAFVEGTGGNTIRFVRNLDRLSWQETTGPHVEVSASKGCIESFRKVYDGPIQQLCFAKAFEGKEGWLAVRRHTTSELVPLVVDSEGALKSPGIRSHHTLGNFIEQGSFHYTPLSLPVERTGGSSHADVSFNPWAPRQFAVIDRKGYWSVWAIEHRSQRKGLFEFIEVASGHLHERLAEGEGTSDAFDDGWGRIIWFGSHTTLLVASRTFLALLSTDKPHERFNVRGLNSETLGDTILDLKGSASDCDQAFVLTSTRIFWLRFTPPKVQKGPNGEFNVQILLSWKHFLDPADPSLKLSVVKDQNASGLLLYSGISSMCAFFAFRISGPSGNIPISICGPCNAPLSDLHGLRSEDHALETNDAGTRTILTIVLDGVADVERKENFMNWPESIIADTVTQFYKFSVLTGDFSLTQCLLALAPSRLAASVRPLDRSKSGRVSGSSKEYSASGLRNADDGCEAPVQGYMESLNNSRSKHEPTVQIKLAKEDPWTLDMGWMRSRIQTILDNETTLFSEILESVRLEIEQSSSKEPWLPRSLIQFTKSELILEDIDIASNALIDLLESLNKDVSGNEQGAAEVEPCIGTWISPALSSAVGIGSDLVPAVAYDNLVRRWVGSLPPDSSSRVRIALEIIARSVAGQLCLASYQHPFNGLGLDDRSNSTELSDLREATLSLRPKDPSTESTHKGKGKARDIDLSQLTLSKNGDVNGSMGSGSSPRGAFPTPEPTPSLRSRSSMSSITQAESAGSRRLGSMTTMVPQPQPNDATSSILKHWVTGDDPWKYDWHRPQEAIAAQKRRPSGRAKTQTQEDDRLEERHKRRREGLSSQLPPVVAVGSQPQTVQGLGTQESSVATPPIVMSQMERGVHGGRKQIPAKRNVHKKVAGFR